MEPEKEATGTDHRAEERGRGPHRHALETGRPTGKVLVVDDEPLVVKAFQRILSREGHRVEAAFDGATALDLIRKGYYDVILSDLSMPGMNGLELLRATRDHDLDVPVILITGGPAVETAARAIEYGAFRYLLKPVDDATLVETVARALQLHEMARLKRRAVDLVGTLGMQIGDRAGLEAKVSEALATLSLAFQPIVVWPRREVFAYEALLRTKVPALPDPSSVLAAAERLGRLNELGRAIRGKAAAAVAADAHIPCFVNLHPKDLLDEALFDPSAPLSTVADRVVLEVTERMALEGIEHLRPRIADLRTLGFRIAIDDLGAGYAGLTSFAHLEPEFVKLDIELIREIHRAPVKRKLVGSMAALCRDMGIRLIAEGVEQAEERDALAEQGVELLQGFLFARPASPAPPIAW